MAISMGARGAIWTTWAVLQTFALSYCLLAVVAIKNVTWLRGQERPAGSDLPSGRAFNAVLASLVLSIIALAVGAAWSLAVLLRSTAKKDRITGFAHGSLLTQALYTAILMVVVGCVLNAFSTGLPSLESDFKGAWTSSDTRAYNATYVLAFFVAGLCALLTCLLALFAHSAFLGAKPVAAGGAAA